MSSFHAHVPTAFVHLSDIHFGQEVGSELFIHDDVKDRLIDDAADLVMNLAGGQAAGLIITGDIAYSGKHEEYQRAGEWLDRLTEAIGCEKTAVQIVPGNHDIDRDGISSGCQLMLDQIIAGGESKLDEFLADELDREVLYGRFAAYRKFAEAYDCPLDKVGGLASDRKLELATGRVLRFIGLNSALVCSAHDQKGRLLLGARQHVLPSNLGEELVVLCHHPLNWLQDSEDARRYIRSRARVFMCGHEHKPSVKMEAVRNDGDLVMLSAGATVPPKVEGGYNYAYNLLIFDWDPFSDNMKMTILPRSWSPEDTRFDADIVNFSSSRQIFVVRCPNFQRGVESPLAECQGAMQPTLAKGTQSSQAEDSPSNEPDGNDLMADTFPITLLRFFRDLSPGQRIDTLVKLKILPEGWHDPLTHNIERQFVNALAEAGRLGELELAIDNALHTQSGGRSDNES